MSQIKTYEERIRCAILSCLYKITKEGQAIMSQTKTYEERLQECAQMHANKAGHEFLTGAHVHFKEEAEITIAAAAEAIIVYAFGSVDNYKSIEPNGGYVTNYLIENGYVQRESKEVIDEIITCPDCDTKHSTLVKCPFCTEFAPTIKIMEAKAKEGKRDGE